MKELDVKNGRITVYVPRELDDHAATRIKEQVDKVIAEQWIRTVIFDFRDTALMDSSGIGMILGRYKKITYSGGKVEAVHLSDRIRRMLVLSGLCHVIRMEQEGE